jgi:hypothetical protein
MAHRAYGWDEEYRRQEQQRHQDGGWMDGDAWLGQGPGAWARTWADHVAQGRVYRPFDEARAFARSLKLTNRAEWLAWARSGARPADIPGNPQQVYLAEWGGWADWLGTTLPPTSN